MTAARRGKMEAFAHRSALCARSAAARAERLLARMQGSVRARGIVFLLLLVAIACVMYPLNAHTPLQMDDYDYSVSWATGKPLAGVVDVFASQAAHYRLWGGRSVVHTLAQLFLYWGKGVFSAANTAAYLLLLLEVYALARPRSQRFCWPLLLGAHLFLFFGVPFFGTVFLWLDGACNYLWGTLIALWPLLIARSAREGGFFARGGWRGALAAALCFLGGWTNENTACGVLALTGALLIRDCLRGARLGVWRWAALAAQGLGAAMMILAPGNFARASGYVYGSMALEMLRRLASVTAYTAIYAGGLLAIFLFAGAAGRALCVPQRTGWALALVAGGLLAALAMIASPELSDRSFTGVLVLVLAGVLVLVGDVFAGTRAFDSAASAALILLLAVFAHSGYRALGDVAAHEAAWNVQLARAQVAIEAGAPDVTLESVPSRSRFTMDIALGATPQEWPNSTLGKALGIDIFGM